MPLDAKNKCKIRDFLRVNLSTLQGGALGEFMERYEVKEASMVEMMLLDFGAPDGFVAVPHPTKEKTHFLISADMADKILVLEDSIKEKPIP